MRKLILATAILASGISTYATSNSNNLFNADTICTVVNNEFKEISIEKLPIVVVETVKEYFPKATISKAFMNEKGQYKLELLIEKKTKVIYSNKEGNLLDEKELSKK